MLRIYLTDLQAYNEGHLVGKWIELPISPNKLSQAISEVLSEGESISGTEHHEEWFITDYEWDEVEVFEVDEYADLTELCKRLERLETLEADQHMAVAFLLAEGLANDFDDAVVKAADVMIHKNKEMVDIAYDLIQDNYSIHELSPIIAKHIDYEGIASELEEDGTYWEVNNDVFKYVG